MGQFPIELVRSVVVGELNFALVTAPLLNADITAVPFAQAPLYAVLPESHAAINKEHLGLEDLVNDEWILFPKRLQPIVHDAILAVARRGGIKPKCTHDVVTAEQAIHLVSEQVGVGIVTKPNVLDYRTKNVILKPFSDKSLCFETYVIMRKGDDSRLTNQFVRTLLRKLKPPPQDGSQMELSLSA
jgi:DNA-binding transcriptional LysR family regulator